MVVPADRGRHCAATESRACFHILAASGLSAAALLPLKFTLYTRVKATVSEHFMLFYGLVGWLVWFLIQRFAGFSLPSAGTKGVPAAASP